MPPLDGWANFYVIIGSSAGALIGLQFVVITLIAGRPVKGGEAQASDAFATPGADTESIVTLGRLHPSMCLFRRETGLSPSHYRRQS